MNDLKLSKRLKQAADWIKPGGTVADIGTDHGYLPVYIAKNNISDNIIAMDLRAKPLEKARENIKCFGVCGKIQLRLSDGMEKLKPGEADTVIICGMGGRLMRSILENGRDRITENTQLILSPQSELRDFREFLVQAGYETLKETMLFEDGQFYVIMECVLREGGSLKRTDDGRQTEEGQAAGGNARRDDGQNSEQSAVKNSEHAGHDKMLEEVFLRYGRLPLMEKNEALKKYLLREEQLDKRVLNELALHDNESVKTRISQLEYDLECIRYALKIFENQVEGV